MATAKVTTTGVVVTLELTGNEARYVYDALSHTDPTPEAGLGGPFEDPVFTALGDALTEAGLDRYDGDFAKRN